MQIMKPTKPKILDVGQCDLDHGNISHMLQTSQSAEVDRAHNLSDAIKAIREHDYNLVLVNRIFDEDGQEGLALIRQVKDPAFGKEVTIMLVSNYIDAQDAAVEIGAVRGFGKSALDDKDTIAWLRQSIA